jgi:class 3 adenylate cyclase
MRAQLDTYIHTYIHVRIHSWARRLLLGEYPIIDHHASTTVLFSDIVEYTNLTSRTGAEDVIAMLNAMFSGFDQLCGKHGVSACACAYVCVCVKDSGFVAFSKGEKESECMSANKSGRKHES